jgi:hypothetical protein
MRGRMLRPVSRTLSIAWAARYDHTRRHFADDEEGLWE